MPSYPSDGTEKLTKREVNRLVKLSIGEASIIGLTSSHKYSVVKKAIQKLKDQGIEPPEELKKILTLSAKAWLNDLI